MHEINTREAVYFASDFHLGLPQDDNDYSRQKFICRWLEHIARDASHIFLLGDLFDAWFEYKNVIPKEFTRFLGTLASLSDKGIKIYIFSGNHDIWMRDYFQKEMNIPVFHEKQTFIINGKKFLLAHGDGLGPGDKGYKRLKKLLRNPLAQWLYRWMHPDWGLPLARYFSRKGDKHVTDAPIPFLGMDKEWLVQYALKKLEQEHFDYFIFGHRHLFLDISLNEQSRYINLGDWIRYNSYARFEGENLTTETFVGNNIAIQPTNFKHDTR